MNEHDLDRDLQPVAHALYDLGRQAPLDAVAKNRLRADLLRRHRELAIEAATSHARVWRFGAKRMLLAAPATLAALGAAAAAILLPALPHGSPQTAEAERLTAALARTAPTVTAWQFTVRSNRSGETRVLRLRSPLSRSQRLYVVHDRTYLWSNGKWNIVPAAGNNAGSPSYWQWAFARLPTSLAAHDYTRLAPQTIGGVRTEGIRYTVPARTGTTVTMTAWVETKSGLVRRLVRVVSRGGHVVERDVAEYRYQRQA